MFFIFFCLMMVNDDFVMCKKMAFVIIKFLFSKINFEKKDWFFDFVIIWFGVKKVRVVFCYMLVKSFIFWCLDFK